MYVYSLEEAQQQRGSQGLAGRDGSTGIQEGKGHIPLSQARRQEGKRQYSQVKSINDQR